MLSSPLIQQNFACHYSPVFKAAFDSAFVEGQTQIYRLNDVNRRVFPHLINYLYTERVDLSLELYEKDEPESVKDQQAAQEEDLMQLWVLADKLLIPSLQNGVVETFECMWREGTDRAMCTTCATYVYEHTAEHSPLQKLVADHCAFDLNDDHVLKARHDYPKELLLDMVHCLQSPLKLEGRGVDPNDKLVSKVRVYANTKSFDGYRVPEDK